MTTTFVESIDVYVDFTRSLNDRFGNNILNGLSIVMSECWQFMNSFVTDSTKVTLTAKTAYINTFTSAILANKLPAEIRCVVPIVDLFLLLNLWGRWKSTGTRCFEGVIKLFHIDASAVILNVSLYAMEKGQIDRIGVGDLNGNLVRGAGERSLVSHTMSTQGMSAW